MISPTLLGVLDIACGPGEWLLNVAEAYSHMQVTGVDISEMPTTNKPAVTRYTELFTRALLAVGQSFSADGKQIGIVPVLPCLLAEAGFQPGGSQQQVFDFVTGTPDERAVFFLNNYKTGFLLMKPFLVKSGVTTAIEIDTLYSHVLAEIDTSDFSANTLVLRVWGYHPA